MDIEVWKDIPGYEGRYQASTDGRIKSLARTFNRVDWRTGKITKVPVNEKILKPGKFNSHGHLSVFLRNEEYPNGIGRPVHQLIALTFIGEPPAGMIVLHRNDNPLDNRIENLHYGTPSENSIDRYQLSGGGLKLTINDVREIRERLKSESTQREIAKEFNVSDTTIYYIKRGERFEWVK